MQNTMNKIKITSKGQITIPKSIREKLDIKEGMYLDWIIKDGSIVLRPLPDSIDKLKLINFAHQESRDSVGLSRVREMGKGFNLNMPKQVRKIREDEFGDNE